MPHNCRKYRPVFTILSRSQSQMHRRTRLHAFARSCFLTHPRSPMGDTVPENCCRQADRRSPKFPMFQSFHRRLWVKVRQIFHTGRAPRGLFTVKVWAGVTAENFERIAKTWNFCTCTRKSALCLPRGSKVKVEHIPCRNVGHCLMVPQPF